jgi:hypothetical protein
MACVLRGFCACNVLQVRFGENPRAALAIKKKSQFLIGKWLSIKSKYHFTMMDRGSKQIKHNKFFNN